MEESLDCASDVDDLCARLSGLNDIDLPIKRSECEGRKAQEIPQDEIYKNLKIYFKTSPLKFLQRYHKLIAQEEISCFNNVPQSENMGYYIRKICKRWDLESRQSLDKSFVSKEVKNRRYQALQKLLKEGNYFCEKEMKTRSPHLYEHYIGRFLTTEEREEKMKNESNSKPPMTLVSFFMDVMDKKEKEDTIMDEDSCEEFDSDDSDNDTTIPDITVEEKAYLKEEFESRMYQSFLDGHDRDFPYEEVDCNADYDDFKQMERDGEDQYFDEEEPSSNTIPTIQDNESEDELDKYMRTVEKMRTESEHSNTAVT